LFERVQKMQPFRFHGLIRAHGQRECLLRIISICLLLTVSACTSYDSKLYEGKVVDEQGSPIKDVSITLCYLGWDWDWSMPGGFPLVMGKSFCSDTVLTDTFGQYKVVFSGPPSTFILANHKDWMQLKSFLASGSKVELIQKDVYNQRIANQEREKERAFRMRRQGESEIDYYCRVIQRRSDKVDLVYLGKRITITQTLLSNQGKVVFGVAGPYDIVQVLSGDIVLFAWPPDGRPRLLVKNFGTLSEKDMCGDSTYFIKSSDSTSPNVFNTASSIKMKIESVRAVFVTKVWNQE